MPAAPDTPKTRRTYASLVAATRGTVAAGEPLRAERVAATAGVSTATFYVYFPSNNDALAAAFDSVLVELNERAGGEVGIERLLDVGLAPVVRNLARAVISVFRDNALVFRAAVARLPESRAIRDAYRRRQAEGLDVLRRFVELGAKAGCIRPNDHDAVVRALLVTLQGYNNPLLLTARPPARVVDELASMLHGLLAP